MHLLHLLQLFNASPGENFPRGDRGHVVEKRTRRSGGGPVSDGLQRKSYSSEFLPVAGQQT